jgi:hypothetical protein
MFFLIIYVFILILFWFYLLHCLTDIIF